MTDKLKLRAEQGDDLQVISSVLQDAILRVGDVAFSPKSRSLTLRLARFRHEHETASERIVSGLRIDSVLSVKTKGLNREEPDAYAVLLSLGFKKGETAPEGAIDLIFAGGGEIRVGVECIDVTLADISSPRKTDKTPLHPSVAS